MTRARTGRGLGNGTPPFGGFYEASKPLFVKRETVKVEYPDLLPAGCLTARVIHNLANKLHQIDKFSKQHGTIEVPYLKYLQAGNDGRVHAFVVTGSITLKLALRSDDEWIVLGDALKVSD